MAGARKTSRERAGCLTFRHHRKRPVMPTAPGTVSRRHSRILVLAAAAGWSSLRSSNPAARRDVTRRLQIRSTAHDRHRPLTTLQCCSQLSLVVDRQRACSADDRSRAPAHSRGDGDRNSFIASPGPATASFGSRPHPAVTTPTSQPIARGSQIAIAPARRTVVPMPARGFLPRGLSDACPSSVPHYQVTGRHLITLNDSGRSLDRNGTARPDTQETFLVTPADRRVGQKAVIRVRLLDMPTAGSRQLIEQPLRFFQIGGVEALGEPAVDGRKKFARLGPPALLAPPPGEARRGPQFIGLCLLPSRDA